MPQVDSFTSSVTNNDSVTPDRLRTDMGKVTVAESVVQKIAGIACREIGGVHAMGSNSDRTFGAKSEPTRVCTPRKPD